MISSPCPRGIAAVVVRIVVLSLLLLGTALAQPVSKYDQRLAAARTLAAEGSHALARTAFAEAQSLAPTDEQRRWCRLWILEQEQAGKPERESAERIQRELIELLTPYEKNADARDAFWAAAASLMGTSQSRLDVLAEVAGYWATQPVSSDGAEQFARSLLALGGGLAESRNGFPSNLATVLEMLREAIDSPSLASRPERPKIALLHARALQAWRLNLHLASEQVTAAYELALALATCTPVEPEARLHQASWALRSGVFASGQWPDQDLAEAARRAQPTGEDFRRVLAMLDSALAKAPPQPADPNEAIMIAELRARQRELPLPQLTIETNDAYLPESRFAFGLTVQHLAEVELKLFRVDLATLHAVAFEERASNALPPAITGAVPKHTWRLSTGLSEPLGRKTSHRAWPEALEPGAYVLLGRDPSGRLAEPVLRWFVVTRVQGVAQRMGGGDLEVCVVESETGRLVAGPVKATAWQGNISLALAPVEAGRARLTSSDIAHPANRYTIIGEAEGQPFVIPRIYLANHTPASWRAHLLADRPLYQPGETAQWKLTLRRTEGGELHVPAGLRLKVIAGTREDVQLGSWEVTLDALGSAAGELRLPATMAPGAVMFGVGISDDERALAAIDAFSVQHFRAPEITLSMTPGDPQQIFQARAGSQVEFKLAARYFSGEPLANTKLTVHASLSGQPSSYDHERNARLGTNSYPPMLVLTAMTDAKGEARVRVALPPGLPSRAHVRLHASCEGSGLEARAALAFDVLPHGYTAQLAAATDTSPRERVVQPWDRGWLEVPRVLAPPARPVSLALFLRDGQGSPVSARGEVVVERATWEEIWRTPKGEIVAGAALREYRNRSEQWLQRELGWERVHGAERREMVERLTVVGDAAGRTVVACPALPAGYYRVSYWPEGPIAERREPMSSLDLFVADASTAWLPVHAEQPVLIPEASEPGEPIRVLAILPHGERQALASVGGVSVGESRRESFPGNTRLLEFAWRPGYWSGAKVGLVAFDGENHQSAEIDVRPSRANHATLVEVSPVEARSRPGEKTKLKIRTTDAAGRPVASDVALSVADSAVTSLIAGPRESASATFLAHEPLSSTRAVSGPRPVDRGPALPPGSGAAPTLENEMVTLSPFEVSVSRDSMGFAGSSMRMADVAAVATPVRGTFSYTAYWAPQVKTDAQGEAVVEFAYPDNLTEWQISAESIAADNCFGNGQATTRTTLPFQARLRMPRSLVAGDTAGLLGAVLNSEPTATTAQLEFAAADKDVLALASPTARQSLAVPGAGEAVATTEVRAVRHGQSLIRFTGVSDAGRDAMEWPLPVQEDGFLQRTGVTARAAARPVTVTLNLPKPLDPARTKVELQVSPGIVPALIEALPYLVDYPYGCVEQTMSRFLPAAIVARLLHDLNFTPTEVEQRLMGSTAKPATAAGPGVGKLDEVVTRSLALLIAAQNPDGSFGWFAHGEPDPYMTAYVLRGLNAATEARIAMPDRLLLGTYEAVARMLDEKSGVALAPAETAWLLSALTGLPTSVHEANVLEALRGVFDRLYKKRDNLSPSGIALLAQSAVVLERRDELRVLRRNLENGVVRASSAEFGATAQWGRTSDYFSGLDGAVETTALCLQALLAIDPQDPLVDAAATWLLVNRQSGRWHNTRDTALSVLALHDYARARGATVAQGRYRLSVGGQVVAERTFDRDSLLQPATFLVDPKLLRPGANRITLARLDGTAPCFLVATAESWATAATAKPAGSFLTVQRDYLGTSFRPSLLGPPFPHTAPLPPADARVAANDLVECRLVVQAKHDLEYVAIEVPKPGGCEPLNALSGWDATLRPITADASTTVKPAAGSQGSRIYREEYPDRSVFFLPRLAAGHWEIRYRMRAVFTGDYRALPATAEAMYVPVINANTEARRLKISAASQP